MLSPYKQTAPPPTGGGEAHANCVGAFWLLTVDDLDPSDERRRSRLEVTEGSRACEGGEQLLAFLDLGHDDIAHVPEVRSNPG